MDVKALHAKIGELTLENDFLEGALIAKPGLQARTLFLMPTLSIITQPDDDFTLAPAVAKKHRSSAISLNQRGEAWRSVIFLLTC